MRKVLIVEDEKFIRKGIRAMIERLETSFQQISESSNGKDALDKLSEEHFDLVITDIKMPEMDGLTLIKEMQKLSVQPKIVILSGYDNFDYAREAIRYGVKSYILKPVKRVELSEVLFRIEDEIKRDESIKQDKNNFSAYLDQVRLNQLKYILLNENISENEIRKVADSVQLEVFKGCFCLALINPVENASLAGDCGYCLPYEELVNDFMQIHSNKMFSFSDTNGNPIVLSTSHECIEMLAQYLNIKLGRKCGVIGVSDMFPHVTDLRKAYLQAQKACKYRLAMTCSTLIYNSTVSNLSKDFIVPSDMVKKIAQMVGTDKFKEIDTILSQLFNLAVLKTLDIAYMEQTADCITRDIIKYFNDMIPQKSHNWNIKYDKLSNIYKFDSLQNYVHSLKDYLFEVNEYLTNLHAAYQARNEIDVAVKYIKENYNRDLNMATVANYVSLNYTYFSQLFKEYTGVSFVDYLRNIRIDKAKELLKSTNCRIYEVAEAVGYPNAKQFTKIFGEVTGISPVEYRNKRMG
jgi:two-component system, response regulator YesN